MGFIDNGVSGFVFSIIVTVFIFRSVIVRQNTHGSDWGKVCLILLAFMWVVAILEIANSMWEVIKESHDYSYLIASATINGFIIGLIIHIVLYNNPKYAGKK
ncbi:hypothetical protein Q4493_06650 [Colwellia sp. 1_MG-2023]|uniref:hypothetical protein n=1 Tax=Colwellia sp. 1_MG-2023 TaxID=3062649 RepID=UPI0026E3F310|nr:hypothetical protein [Colwellia sp. 1_MG-2023]MDO6445456.1 hypothetical protein [Colwellia sp. 1_MG-2023]